MAIALRAVGTVLKADIGLSGSPQSVSLPAGHVSTDWILLTVLTNDNTGPTTPSGWTFLMSGSVGTSTKSPYAAYAKMHCYGRVDNGSLGSTVSVSFNATNSWPTGKPTVIAWTVAYSGIDVTAPTETMSISAVSSSVAAQTHPQLTSVVANDWLVTIRASASYQPSPTHTCSVGTDVERVDEIDGFAEGLAGAYYDSNTALVAGLQTQRTTTASRTCEWGSVKASILIKPASPANSVTALPGCATVSAIAYDATTLKTIDPWDLCAEGGLPVYNLAVDWNQDGDFSDTGEDITADNLDDVTISYGRDQNRQLSPAAIGTASLRLCNVGRDYSPEYSASPLFGNLDPARDARFQVTWAGGTFPIFRGRIDDYNVHAEFEDRSVEFTFLDGLALLQGFRLSTGVYDSLRTGDVINTILDLAGWTGGRDIDLGATIVKHWWAEGTDAYAAIQEIVKSEGPPSVAYVSPDGTFVFHDRHHRLQDSASLSAQETFVAEAFDCDSPAVTGLSMAKPFVYEHGWRDVINSVVFEVQERSMDAVLTDVWTSEDTYTLSTGQSVEIDISTSDPFKDAITPVEGTDFTRTGAGTVNVVLSRDSGQSVRVTLLAVGGSVTISGLRLRAHAIPVRRTIKVSRVDSGSVTSHGERAYPDTAPWANANDAGAIADMILLHYSQRRPTVQLRIQTQSPAHFVQVLQRTISDRVHITNNELGLDDDFFVERVTHTIQRSNQAGKPPVHAVVLGCEKQLTLVSNPFRFDVRGAGFDDGVFDPVSADDADTVFIFDHATQGQFDLGMFGT
jgi:hypothetical protein